MKKYLLITKQSIQEMFTYRLQTVVWILVSIVPAVVSLYVFRQLGAQVSVSYVTAYFLLVGVVRIAIFTLVDNEIGEMIYYGQLSSHLLKPYSFIKSQIARWIASPIVRLTWSAPFIIFAVIYLLDHGFLMNLDPVRILIFILTVIAGFFLSFSFIFIVGFLPFWTEYMYLFSNLNSAITIFFSGGLIPLRYFPEQVLQVVRWLPFRYMLSFQMDVLLDHQLPSSTEFAVFAAYLVVMWGLVPIVFKAGLKKYESAGN